MFSDALQGCSAIDILRALCNCKPSKLQELASCSHALTSVTEAFQARFKSCMDEAGGHAGLCSNLTFLQLSAEMLKKAFVGPAMAIQSLQRYDDASQEDIFLSCMSWASFFFQMGRAGIRSGNLFQLNAATGGAASGAQAPNSEIQTFMLHLHYLSKPVILQSYLKHFRRHAKTSPERLLKCAASIGSGSKCPYWAADALEPCKSVHGDAPRSPVRRPRFRLRTSAAVGSSAAAPETSTRAAAGASAPARQAQRISRTAPRPTTESPRLAKKARKDRT